VGFATDSRGRLYVGEHAQTALYGTIVNIFAPDASQKIVAVGWIDRLVTNDSFMDVAVSP
jgi:hypothetical protein